MLFFKSFRYPSIQSILAGKNNRNLPLFLLVLAPNTLSAFFEGVSFGLVLLALNVLNGATAPSLSWSFISQSINSLTSPQLFTFFISLAIAAQLLRSGLTYFGRITSVGLGTRIQTELQEKVYQQILQFSFPCVNKYKVGDLLEYAKIPATLIGHLMEPLNQFVVSSLAILASLCVMLFLSVPLTLMSIAFFGIFTFSQKFIIQKISGISYFLSEHLVHFSKHTVQSLHALRPIHTYHRQERILEHIRSTLRTIAKNTKRLNFWSQSISPINEMIGTLMVGLFLALGQFMLADGTHGALPILLTFIIIIHRLNGRIQLLLSSAAAVASYWGEIARLEDILSPKNKEFLSKSDLRVEHFSREIRFQNVSLSYEGAKNFAIRDLNLTLSKGSMIALVGASGAGKSSLIDLLLRLYQPSSGAIFLDSLNIQSFDLESWRKLFGVVSQDTFIFNETIEGNIQFGLPEATPEQIRAASEMAGAHEFIMKLPEGYQTTVGERGHRLSGGERQRIALARALVRDAPILIFDEATSNLDSHSESIIQSSLDAFRGKKTMIVVAHRLSTILSSDKIFVLDKGQVAESGTHTELLALNGHYAHFWNVQFKKEHSHPLETSHAK